MDILGIPLFVVLLAFLMVAAVIDHRRRKQGLLVLRQQGFEYIFNGKGRTYLAFNLPEATIRIGKLGAAQCLQRPVSIISHFEWKWVEQNAVKRENRFVFFLSDLEISMHEVFYSTDERLAEVEWAKLQAVYNHAVSYQTQVIEHMPRTDTYDLFISHASEDKEAFVRPLVNALQALGLRVWYDEFTLEIGDSLRRSIDHGLGHSRFGIVVLSPSFFAKQWTQYELDALVNRSMSGEKVVLPIWHEVQHLEVSRYSHSLADKVAFSSSALSIDEMATAFLRVVQRELH